MQQARVIDRDTPSLPVPLLRSAWLLWLGIAALAIPTMVSLAKIVWSTEQGAHGPIVLATGLWLLVRVWPDLRRVAQPGSPVLAGIAFTIGLIAYVVFHITSTLFFEGIALFTTVFAVFYYHYGARALAMLWFPIAYLLFILPVPYFIVAAITRILKLKLASWSVSFMAMLGFNVASSGVTIYIDQYQLLVATACSGLNSLIGLSAIGLFYIYLRYANDWRRALVLLPLVPVFAIAANFVRVLVLMLATHFGGASMMEGFVHSAASALMFAVSVTLLIIADGVIGGLVRLARLGAHR